MQYFSWTVKDLVKSLTDIQNTDSIPFISLIAKIEKNIEHYYLKQNFNNQAVDEQSREDIPSKHTDLGLYTTKEQFFDLGLYTIKAVCELSNWGIRST